MLKFPFKIKFIKPLHFSSHHMSYIEHNLTPGIIRVPPKNIAEVIYENNVQVQLGNIIKPTQAKSPPKSVSWPIKPGMLYTLTMFDPDWPSRQEPILRSFKLWLVGNIPGLDLTKADHLVEYVGVGPARNSGMHRYVVLVYEQERRINFTNERYFATTIPRLRNNFSIVQFANKFNLTGPIAGNFFRAEFDDYVPNVYKKFGFVRQK